jgi:hypothetical protein
LNAEKEALFQISRRFVRGDEARVIKIRSTPAALVGYFTAASADDAIKRAIVEREISDPLTQSRLAAQKVREIASS